MKGLTIPVVVVSALALCLAGPGLQAEQNGNNDKVPGSITVAFGTGLNNAAAGSTPNHHIVPQEFKVRITRAKNLAGDVLVVPATVNFVIAGFHWPWVYKPGVTLEEVVARIPTPPTGPFVNYQVNALGEDRVFAKGVNPGTPPTFADANVNPSGVQNRNDAIAFSAPGRYLVICNVRGHFIDGMYAWINVIGLDDDEN